MYILNDFQEVRTEEIMNLIKNYPLACIVANTKDGLIATHVPLIMKTDNTLIGHIAVNNDMRILVSDDQEVLCIFKGEDAYISANYYPSKFEDHKKVPTWNYQVVHIYGNINYFIDNKSKLSAVGMLTKISEEKANGNSGWKMSDAPKEYLMDQLKELIVFEINISRIQAQSKLSQNREKKDFDSVIKNLKETGKENLAKSMLKLERN
ncbi:FMN-binding negative transcriptional regulator [Acinetobacter radioresistens]|uniref:FMN-binding negative transcriptional regulator n=1 Tax=Acinetobacter radioresistens TaxID=40216 RepID=UPI000DADEAD0|nr:FMN-binding negative transcriptional regulator [Acinetobacter radioresistens]AWV87007.1 FMN-binding negative transcriptional regulator [Acinetobacter radioresistens]MCX0328645.1 FMN-binding negative transcriptional regulator [Acinetobacter radioresistens]RJL71147.1 FMN-binding negative transcriptional regulator [Acinetobacter radioresistens]